MPPIYVSTDHWADEVAGRRAERVGRMTYQALLTDAISTAARGTCAQLVHARGAGEARAATGLAPLQPAVTAPMAVRSVTATHTGDHEVLVGWDEPLSPGGALIDSFVLDARRRRRSQCVEATGRARCWAT